MIGSTPPVQPQIPQPVVFDTTPLGDPSGPATGLEVINAETTQRILDEIRAGTAFCKALVRQEYVIDCLSDRLQSVADGLSAVGEYSEVRAALENAAQQLHQVVLDNASQDLARQVARAAGMRSSRALTPISTAALARPMRRRRPSSRTPNWCCCGQARGPSGGLRPLPRWQRSSIRPRFCCGRPDRGGTGAGPDPKPEPVLTHCAAGRLRVMDVVRFPGRTRHPHQMVTIKQIASAVGVSSATVSRVLNFDQYAVGHPADPSVDHRDRRGAELCHAAQPQPGHGPGRTRPPRLRWCISCGPIRNWPTPIMWPAPRHRKPLCRAEDRDGQDLSYRRDARPQDAASRPRASLPSGCMKRTRWPG